MLPLVATILGGIGVLGTAIVVTYWEDIVQWLSDLVSKLSAAWKKLTAAVKHGALVFAQKIKDAFAQITHKLYYRAQGKWMERSTSAVISESELPPDILAEVRAKHEAANITKIMEQKLDLKIA